MRQHAGRLGLARDPGAQGMTAQEATAKHSPQHVCICVAPTFNFFVPCSDFKFAVRVGGPLRSTSSLHTTALSVSKVTPLHQLISPPKASQPRGREGSAGDK